MAGTPGTVENGLFAGNMEIQAEWNWENGRRKRERGYES